MCNNQIFDLLVKKGAYTIADYGEFVEQNFCSTPEIRKMFGSDSITLEETVATIRAAGGVAVLAHPAEKGHYMDHACFEEMLQAGIMGVEINHPEMTTEEKVLYKKLCEEHGLYKLGGIDHSGLLGGFTDRMPGHEAEPENGCATEQDFMQLYRRELG